ncbi:glycosyltransferase family 2 protein [Flavobacterium denitrificans]|uniref:glycosyltransferase family 2 protein n=1 Tax=Flavobacterium denitrificans TaxID=281361 RepID=UPI0004117160|nr:glycosyltransferase family 2 protein [Flavobacterium denitrificans]
MNEHYIIKVSIIIPTFNRIDLLQETLLSVKKQTISNWECLIIDDGSADQTDVIIPAIISDDCRFKYFKRPENYLKGAASCRNYGFELSKGKYIQWLDDDDLLSINKLELQVKLLDKLNDEKIFASCDWDLFWPQKKFERNSVFDSNSYLTANNFFLELRKKQTFIPIHAFLMHRDLISISGNWNTDLKLNDDAEFMTRILIKSKKLANTRDCFVLYRSYESGRISTSKDVQSLKSLLYSLQLMSDHLKFNDIQCVSYFKWKLFKVFYNHWKSNKVLLKEHFYFFKENEINLRLARYYMLKYTIYKKLYPFYKKYK